MKASLPFPLRQGTRRLARRGIFRVLPVAGAAALFFVGTAPATHAQPVLPAVPIPQSISPPGPAEDPFQTTEPFVVPLAAPRRPAPLPDSSVTTNSQAQPRRRVQPRDVQPIPAAPSAGPRPVAPDLPGNPGNRAGAGAGALPLRADADAASRSPADRIPPAEPNASTASGTDPEEEIRPPRPPVTITPDAGTPGAGIQWWALPMGLAAAAAAGWMVWRRHRRQKPLPGKAPLEEARRALQSVDEKRNVLPADQLADQASGVIRRFIHDAFGVAATRQTTEEFLGLVARKSAGPLSAWQAELSGFLRRCDQAKFAGSNLDELQRFELVDAARRFLQNAARPHGHGLPTGDANPDFAAGPQVVDAPPGPASFTNPPGAR